jgi:ribulose 1,5-bisphosphate synthetase/thiazole synthase
MGAPPSDVLYRILAMSTRVFDAIVVGAGSVGLPTALRLAESVWKR